MAPSRILAAAVLSAALAVPTTAGAAQRTAQSQRPGAQIAVAPAKAPTPMSAAAAVGRRYWGAVPCNGRIRIVAKRPLPAGLDVASDAWVTFDTPLGANDLAAPASSYTNCTIAFGRSRWPTSTSMYEDWDLVCATMIHELGHLLGHPHDSTPGSVMAPVFTDRSSIPRICRATRPTRTARSSRHHL